MDKLNDKLSDNRYIKNSVDITYETLEKAEKTIENLHYQGEKIDNIKKNLENIDHNLNVSEILVNKMLSIKNRVKYYIYGENKIQTTPDIIQKKEINKTISKSNSEIDILLNNLKNIRGINYEIGNVLTEQTDDLTQIDENISKYDINIKNLNDNISSKLF